MSNSGHHNGSTKAVFLCAAVKLQCCHMLANLTYHISPYAAFPNFGFLWKTHWQRNWLEYQWPHEAKNEPLHKTAYPWDEARRDEVSCEKLGTIWWRWDLQPRNSNVEALGKSDCHAWFLHPLCWPLEWQSNRWGCAYTGAPWFQNSLSAGLGQIFGVACATTEKRKWLLYIFICVKSPCVATLDKSVCSETEDAVRYRRCLSLRCWQTAILPHVGMLNSARSAFSTFHTTVIRAIGSVVLSSSFIW